MSGEILTGFGLLLGILGVVVGLLYFNERLGDDE